jgi:hypothetical protein
MPRGSRPGERRGGRKKGVPNRVTTEQRHLVKALLDKKMPELEAMIDETRYGIEIEKQTEQGTVVGRLNADPKGAADLMLKLMEFSIPKLGRQEHVGADGGQIQVVIHKES